MALARAPSTFQWFSILATEPESAKLTWLRITSLAFAYTIKPGCVPMNMGSLGGAFVAIMFQEFWYIEMFSTQMVILCANSSPPGFVAGRFKV
jgi:hypothetical protein